MVYQIQKEGTERIGATWKESIIQLCKEHGYELIALEGMDDHEHVFLSAPPKAASSILAKVRKGSTARTLFTKHPPSRREANLTNSLSFSLFQGTNEPGWRRMFERMKEFGFPASSGPPLHSIIPPVKGGKHMDSSDSVNQRLHN